MRLQGIGWDYTDLHKKPIHVIQREYEAAERAAMAMMHLSDVTQAHMVDTMDRWGCASSVLRRQYL